VDPSPDDNIPPEVHWTEPPSGTIGLGVTSAPILTDTAGRVYPPMITVQFSEPISPTTVSTQTFGLVEEPGRPISATVTYDGAARQATLALREPLRPGKTYIARVTATVRDLAGNPLAAPYEWTIRTRSTGTGLPILLR
jgi:large repetitive protein